MLEYNETKISFDEQIANVKANNKYIVSIEEFYINIFIFEKNDIKKIYEQTCETRHEKLEMNKIYDNIFLIVSPGIINLFEIINENNNYRLENKLRIEAIDRIEIAKFSEYNEKLIGAVSENNIVRVWSIDSNFNYINFKPKLLKNLNLFFNHNSNLLLLQGNYKDNSFGIFIYDISYGINVQNEIKRTKKDFIFEISEKNFEELILVNQSSIDFMNLKDEKIYDKIELNLSKKINYVCFYKSIQILIISSSSYIYIIDIGNKKKIFSRYNDKFILTDFFHENNNNIYINLLKYSYIDTFGFELKNNNKKLYQKKENSLFPQNFKKIFTKLYLDYANAEINNEEINKKTYLEIKEISNALHNNYSLSLEIKKKNVVDGVKNFNDKDTIINKYIYLIKLIIQDNTNKDLLKLYLTFLEKNYEFLKQAYKIKENFENEFSKYKVAFTPEEVKNYFKLEKNSEKKEFLDFINEINKENNYEKIIKKCKDIYLGIFNQGIEFSNQELFWFRNKELVVYSLLKMKSDKLKLMKFCIGEIIKRNLLENQNILSNNVYITLLMFLIIMPLEEKDCTDNLDMIESMFKNNIKTDLIFRNKVLNSNNNEKILNYKKAYDTYNNIIDIDKIKKFLKKIFLSNVIKEAFQILYPSYIKFPFENEKDVDDYINKHLKFVVYYTPDSNAITDKFTLDTYIFLKPKNIKIKNIENNQIIKLIENILYTSGIIKTNYHELNHNFYNIFYYHENGNIPLKTPRKEGLDDREGGREMEKLLFGKILYKINIKEALYILNEKNYEKNIYEFREDFKNLYKSNEKKEDYLINGEFSELNLSDNNEALERTNQFFIFISLEDTDPTNYYIESFDYDGIFGDKSIFEENNSD